MSLGVYRGKVGLAHLSCFYESQKSNRGDYKWDLQRTSGFLWQGLISYFSRLNKEHDRKKEGVGEWFYIYFIKKSNQFMYILIIFFLSFDNVQSFIQQIFIWQLLYSRQFAGCLVSKKLSMMSDENNTSRCIRKPPVSFPLLYLFILCPFWWMPRTQQILHYCTYWAGRGGR